MSTITTIEDPSTGGVTTEELQLATRNSGMPLEALRYDRTPAGLHYLLIHFDIPAIDPAEYVLEIGGHVARPLQLSLAQLRDRPQRTVAVTMECAGNGRARLDPRPVSQPWLQEAVGTAEWTGTPVAGLLAEAGLLDGAVEVVFTGHDRGVQGGSEHNYARSLTVQELARGDALLAWAVGGRELPPQHGAPLRLLVPGWYGMTSVKWLARIDVVTEPFQGYQQAVAYRIIPSADAPGEPVTRILPRALMIPPGIPDFLTRRRFVDAGTVTLRGRAWSGRAPLVAVEVSPDGGMSWWPAELQPASDRTDGADRWAWRAWRFDWAATPGDWELVVRAADTEGEQPLQAAWNTQGMANNSAQRVGITVRPAAR